MVAAAGFALPLTLGRDLLPTAYRLRTQQGSLLLSPRTFADPPGLPEPLHYFFSFHLWTKPVMTPPSSYSFSLSWTISARLRPVIA